MIESKYSVDHLGYFNRSVFEHTGDKFRPIDAVDGNLVIVTLDLVNRIRRHREGLDEVGDPKYYARLEQSLSSSKSKRKA